MRAYKNALTIIGIFSLIVTAIHGAWHWYLPTYPVLQSLTPIQLGTLQLMNAAITLFLLMMGVATLVVARSSTLSLQHVRIFSLFLMAFWAGRFVLEIVMPLQIPLLFIEHPGAIAKVIMALPVVLLGVPLLMSARKA